MLMLAAACATLGARMHAQCPDGTPPPCRTPTPPHIPAANTIAVLYFDNLSRDTGDVYLADGLTEELISRLAQVEQLQVKSRTAVAALRGRAANDPASIGRILGVAQLVNGSVLRSGQRLRVNIELTRAATGNSIWARSFDRPSNNLLGVQAEIAESLAVHIAGRLSPAERRRVASPPARNSRAYDLLLRARFHSAQRTTDGLLTAVREFEQAYRLDSTSVDALVGVANTYGQLSSLYYSADIGLSRDSLAALARAFLERAIRRDSLAPSVVTARASSVDPVLALSWLDGAAARDPRNVNVHYAYGIALRATGHDSAAVAEFMRAAELEPDRAMVLTNLGQAHLVARRYQQATRWLDSAATLRPDAGFIYSDQAFARLLVGDTAGARSAADVAGRHGAFETRDVIRALLDARAGDTASARARLAGVERTLARSDCFLSHQCLELSFGLAQIGERDRALDVFERLGPRSTWLVYWSGRPEFDPIRAEQRFVRVVDESRAKMEALKRSRSR